MSKLPCWQPRGISCPCKVGSKNKRIIWNGSRKIESKHKKRLEVLENGSRLIRNWMQPTLNRYKPNMRWRCWWLNRLQKMRKLSIKDIQGFRLTRQDPFLIKLHNRSLSVQIRSLDGKRGVPRCFGTVHGGWRD